MKDERRSLLERIRGQRAPECAWPGCHASPNGRRTLAGRQLCTLHDAVCGDLEYESRP